MTRLSDETLVAIVTLALAAYSLLLAGECAGIWHLLPPNAAQWPRPPCTWATGTTPSARRHLPSSRLATGRLCRKPATRYRTSIAARPRP